VDYDLIIVWQLADDPDGWWRGEVPGRSATLNRRLIDYQDRRVMEPSSNAACAATSAPS
jgi:hypothetical protein